MEEVRFDGLTQFQLGLLYLSLPAPSHTRGGLLCSLGCCGTVFLWPDQQFHLSLQMAAGVQRPTAIPAYVSAIRICRNEQEYFCVGSLGKQRAKLRSDTTLPKSTNL